MIRTEAERSERRGPERFAAPWTSPSPALNDNTGLARERSRSSGLPKWRLRRVEALIEARLSGPVRLVDMAAAAGLSRMHFAAQFKVATGSSPHEFLTRRRIEAAKRLLERTPDPLAQIALSVGFQAQAHFTTVFKRVTGETPGRWRQACRRDAADSLAG